jgi:hypothetical protein
MAGKRKYSSGIWVTLAALQDGMWHTLRDLSASTDIAEACVSAYIRHLRKDINGRHQIDKSKSGEDGLWHYRLVR